ncbi:hypothetical protein BDZ89DRAFT_1162632 [Hymenopellis radicata]|nr:hypothetical protein BDZ89DRAFT_1162632 [Hymenopellis radicata]
MSDYRRGQGNPPSGPPIPPIDSTEWRRQTGQYRRPRGTIVLSYRQLEDAFNGLRAHIERNPAFNLPQPTRGAIFVRDELAALGTQLEAFPRSRNFGTRRMLNQRVSRALNVIAASYTNLRELVDLRRQFNRVLDLYNSNSAAAEQALRAYVHEEQAEERRRNNANDALQRQISAAAGYAPVGMYAPSTVHSYGSAAQSSNVLEYGTSPASSAAIFYANQSTYYTLPSHHSESLPESMNSGVLPSEDAVAALGAARLQAEEALLLAEEARLAAAQRHGHGGGPSRPPGGGQGRPGGGHGGQGGSVQAYYHR